MDTIWKSTQTKDNSPREWQRCFFCCQYRYLCHWHLPGKTDNYLTYPSFVNKIPQSLPKSKNADPLNSPSAYLITRNLVTEYWNSMNPLSWTVGWVTRVKGVKGNVLKLLDFGNFQERKTMTYLFGVLIGKCQWVTVCILWLQYGYNGDIIKEWNQREKG